MTDIALRAHDEDSYREQQLRQAAAEAVSRGTRWGALKPSFKDVPGVSVKSFPDSLREKLKDTKARHYK